MRNVFSPLLSGGSVIACGGFDAVLFWDTLSSHRVTWYYASPTMHHAILNQAADRWVHHGDYICNNESLAIRLEQHYSMIESSADFTCGNVCRSYLYCLLGQQFSCI